MFASRIAPLRFVLVAGVLLALSACGRDESAEDLSCTTAEDCPSGICVDGICAESLIAVEGDADGAALDGGLVDPGRDAGLDSDLPDDATPDDATPDDTTPDDVTPDDTTPDDTTPDDTTPDVAADTTPDVAPDVAADTTPDVAPDVVADTTPDVIVRNACGGTATLDAELGASCGPCGLDRLICDGVDALVCSGATAGNACGGCGALDGTLGASCGECGGGALVCDGRDALVCDGDGATNACGGCGPLAAQPNTPCGRCNSGLWRCDGAAAVVCDGDLGAAAENACGGCVALPDTLGDACGTCGEGNVVCGGANLLVCDDPGDAAVNACGGCGDLPGLPGEACDECGGEWVCTDAGGVRCQPGTPNACGGCLPLPATPGDFCPSFECGFRGGEVACVDENSVACFCEPPPDTCGNGALDEDEGETCDDGNRFNNDGCSATCEAETAFRPNNGCAAPAILARNAVVDFNLCFADDTTDNIETDDCVSDRTDVDVVFRFDLPTRSRVEIEIADDDFGAAVDPIIYIRTACNDEDTQVACGDDVPCGSTDVTGDCIDGLQPRVGRIDTVLDAGRYSLWADSFDARGFECGNVLLRIESTPTD